jgi:hypothetical protein
MNRVHAAAENCALQPLEPTPGQPAVLCTPATVDLAAVALGTAAFAFFACRAAFGAGKHYDSPSGQEIPSAPSEMSVLELVDPHTWR